MEIIVQKFGGTSVSTEERREQVVEKVKEAIDRGYSPVVVVSAMGRKGEPYATDTLLSLLDNNFKRQNPQATDMIMSCGEMISSVVMTNALVSAGIQAVPLTGGQAGIITNDKFTEAKFIDAHPEHILSVLEQGKVPVVTGFQGITESGYITTLGRGGSDTSACILGIALKAASVEIYTDVDGIMTADPRIVNDASLIDVISYNEVFQFADQGAKVIHPRAVELARKANIPIVIKNTMSNCKGTLINNLGSDHIDNALSGITHLANRIQVRVRLKDNKEQANYRQLLDILAKHHISLDLINIFPAEQIFTIDSCEKELLEEVLNEAKINYTIIENCSTIAMVGTGMTGVPGIMAKIINTLILNDIEVLQTADSHMTIWCLIYSNKVPEAINLLHKAFNLGE
ncbi:aspartate kinase [Clostridium chauvoei]|uniref:Aspartokinase n=2 Tax=Clostridium chauvoei TaxID=46867 RepID=S6EK64_9CLOT|nr:aspartate kinase [Clostridium chauvoei]ATD54981.1 aspartate kinase [Clostridium chauvoei]ATD57342.1 aspartate kinase [Clostridium chauvoei]MBX7281518.1 aspartate kinase [Clostridium chauvoei]MBX7284035.1 aspartate kinase [Clostridium chauvoei]MBX7286566.1 aspartate kinase [Clostridium chauvoei]